MKINKQELLDALATLDPAVEDQWTEEGLPTLEAVRDAALDETISREDLSEHAAGFSRDAAAEALQARVNSDEAAKDALKKASELGKVTPKASPEPGADADKAERLKALQADIAEAQKALDEHDAAVAQAKKVREGLTQAIDKAKTALDREFPPVNQATATQAWLASEHEKRLARAQSMQAFGQVGKSPIDQSFTRRTGHGHGRKPVPLMQAQG